MANSRQEDSSYNLDTIGSVAYIARRVEELLCDLKNTFYLDNLDFTESLITDDAQIENFERFRCVVDYAYGRTNSNDERLEDAAKFYDLALLVREASKTILDEYQSYAASVNSSHLETGCNIVNCRFCFVKEYAGKIDHDEPLTKDARKATGKPKIRLKNRDRLKALRPQPNTYPQLNRKLIMLVTRDILEKTILDEKMTLGKIIHKVFVSPAQSSSATQSVAARIADQVCKDKKYITEVSDILRSTGDKSVSANESEKKVKGTTLYTDLATETLDANFKTAEKLSVIATVIILSNGLSPADLSYLESLVAQQSMDSATELLRKLNSSKLKKNPVRFNAESEIVVWLADKLNDTDQVKVKELYDALEYIRKHRNETLHYDGKSNVKVDMDELKRKYTWIMIESGVFEVVYGKLELIPEKLDRKREEWLQIKQDFSDLKYVNSRLKERLELADECGNEEYYDDLSSLLATIKQKQDDYLSNHDEKNLELDMTDFYRSDIFKLKDYHLERGALEWKKAMKNRLTAANFNKAVRTTGPQFSPAMLTDLMKSKVISRKKVLREKYIQFLRNKEENVQLPPFHLMDVGVDADGFLGMKLIENYPELGATPEAIVKKGGKVHLVMMRGIIQNLKKSALKGDISKLKDLSGQDDPRPLSLITEDEWYEIAGLFMAFPDIEMCDYVAYAHGNVCNVLTIKRSHGYVKKISGQSTLEKLREFYFGAMLPQLASPSVTVRESFIDPKVMEKVISEFFPKSQNPSSPDSKSSTCAPKPTTEP